MRRIKWEKWLLESLFAGFIVVSGIFMSCDKAEAKSRIRLSFSKKTYHDVGYQDKLTLKGASSCSSIKWRTSNSSILKVTVHRKSYAWFSVREEGKAIITATYRGRKFKCRITVKKIANHGSGDETSEIGGEDGSDNDSVVKPTDGNGADTSMAPDSGNDSSAAPGVEDSSSGSSSGGEGTRSDDNSNTPPLSEIPLYEQVMDDFEERYIVAGMTEYEKMDAICRFVSNEFTYELYQSDWTRMLETGSGDCYSSRIIVMMLARRIGLKAAACMSLDCHGECIVKADGIIYMTTTGYDEPCPRYYRILQMDMATFNKKAVENHISLQYFEV